LHRSNAACQFGNRWHLEQRAERHLNIKCLINANDNLNG
jgi:hypothetical protein